MGGAASMLLSSPGMSFSDLFITKETKEGWKNLCEDRNFRLSFVDYVKSGSWLDKLTSFVPEGKLVDPPFRSANIASLLSRFNLPPQYKAKVDNILSRSFHSTAFSDMRASTSRTNLVELESAKFLEDYVNVETLLAFTSGQLCCLMFGIIYPIYTLSVSHKNFALDGKPRHPALDEENSVAISIPQGCVQTSYSLRGQELLHGCAAFFEESDLMQRIEENWISTISEFFDESAIAICVIDATNVSLPFMYVNRSFDTLFEFNRGEVISKSSNILHGSHTEPEQIRLFHNALVESQITRLWITQQTKNHNSLLNLLSVMAVRDCALCILLPVHKKSILEKLSAVDDMLTMMSYLVAFHIRNRSESANTWLTTALHTAFPFRKGGSVASPKSNRSGSSGGDNVKSFRSVRSVRSNPSNTSNHSIHNNADRPPRYSVRSNKSEDTSSIDKCTTSAGNCIAHMAETEVNKESSFATDSVSKSDRAERVGASAAGNSV